MENLSNMSSSDLEILTVRKNNVLNKISWHKDRLKELESELKGINEFISEGSNDGGVVLDCKSSPMR